MVSRPRFRSYFRAEAVNGEGIYVIGEGGSHVLLGRAFLSLAPLLRGELTEWEICERLDGQISAEEVFYALAVLRQRGYVTDDTAELPVAETAYWEVLGASPREAAAKLRDARVALVTAGGSSAEPLTKALGELSIEVNPAGAFTVVVAEDYLHPDVETIHLRQLDKREPWLLVRPTGVEGWLGPLFIPEKTACWRCLAHRLSGHRLVERYLQRRTGRQDIHAPAQTSLPSTRRALAALAATAIARWAVEGTAPMLEGRLITFQTASFEVRHHTLVRRPQCQDCGERGLVAKLQSDPVRLEEAGRAFALDGGNRRAPPEETFARLEHHISPLTGVVSRMTRTTPPVSKDEADPGIHAYSTDHNFVHTAHHLHALRHNLRSYSGGKGRSDMQAKTSALCESIERYVGVYQGDEARLTARLDELSGEGVDVGLCMGYSARQYAERAVWNRKGEFFSWVPEPLDLSRPIDWSPAWSLTHNKRRYVATGYCYYDYPFGHTPMFTRADSNGCAGGTTRAEAILQGFLELVERDAVAIWWYNRLRRPGVDLRRFGEQFLVDNETYWRSRGRALWALDLTSDFGIPVFAAMSRLTSGPFPGIAFGLGAHADARVALLRAVTEHNQLLPFVSSASLDPNVPSPGGTIVDWLRNASLETERYLAPAEDQPLRGYSDYPAPGPGPSDLRREVERCVDLAAQRGLETIVHDHSRPDIDLAVVRVIVPGMRHFWRRLGPGRLYDVPVQMGLRDAPVAEEAMNPYPMFI